MKLLVSCALAVSLASPESAYAQNGRVISGEATVVDGDSIKINNESIRLFGIDAFEASQTCEAFACGQLSTLHLQSLISPNSAHELSPIVTCVQRDTDRYGRIVATCSIGPLSLNSEQVRSGYAVAFRRYSLEFVSDEDYAKSHALGAWQYAFIMPDEYRRQAREYQNQQNGLASAATSNSSQTNTQCAIKGNINRHGEKIYHLPNTPNYEETNPEAMFCTEAEAIAAGFRAPRN